MKNLKNKTILIYILFFLAMSGGMSFLVYASEKCKNEMENKEQEQIQYILIGIGGLVSVLITVLSYFHFKTQNIDKFYYAAIFFGPMAITMFAVFTLKRTTCADWNWEKCLLDAFQKDGKDRIDTFKKSVIAAQEKCPKNKEKKLLTDFVIGLQKM